MSTTRTHGSTTDSSSTTNSTSSVSESSATNSTSAVSSSSSNSTTSSTHGSSSSSNSTTSSNSISSNSNHGSSSSSGGSNRESAVRSNDPYPQVKWMWTAICGVVLLLTLWNLLSLYRKRKRQNSKPATKEAGNRRKPSKWDAVQVGARNSFIARGFPKWLYAPETVADALWTAVYFMVTIIITLYDGPWSMGQVNVSNAFGTIVSIVITFQQVHELTTVCGGIRPNPSNLLLRHEEQPYLLAHRYPLPKLELPPSSFIPSDAGLELAPYWSRYCTSSCFVIWGFDRTVRLGRTIYYNRIWSQGRGVCKIEILDDSCLRITAVRPGFKWAAGQHAFLTSPRLSKWGIAEAHPFTMANVPNDAEEVIILARVYQGYTKQLTDSLSANKDKLIRCYLDGPYGSPHSLASYDTVTLVAGGYSVIACLDDYMYSNSADKENITGGTGIAPWTAHLAGLLASQKTTRISYIHIVWLIREATSVCWIAPFIEQTTEKLRNRSDITVKFSFHVTRGQIPAQTEKHTSTSDESASQASTPAIEEISALTHDAEPFPDVTLTKTIKPAVVLSHAANQIVEWHQGRAIFAQVFKEDAQTCPEAMAVGGKPLGFNLQAMYISLIMPTLSLRSIPSYGISP
ncbi:hypothetical protein I315_05503 [Cryptococcus gattii Ru294]|nr:hypothetical protein I315_05503 [Cryptococcus gattii Ru294]